MMDTSEGEPVGMAKLEDEERDNPALKQRIRNKAENHVIGSR